MQYLLAGPAEKPTMSMAPYLAENQASAKNPTCTTSSLGYNPDYTFGWVVKRNNGADVQQLPAERHVDTVR